MPSTLLRIVHLHRSRILKISQSSDSLHFFVKTFFIMIVGLLILATSTSGLVKSKSLEQIDEIGEMGEFNSDQQGIFWAIFYLISSIFFLIFVGFIVCIIFYAFAFVCEFCCQSFTKTPSLAGDDTIDKINQLYNV